MKLILKQKVFSWFDTYNIYDENENIIYKVKGELAWGHLLRLYNNTDTELGFMKQQAFTILPKFVLNIGKQKYTLKKEFTLIKEVFKIEELNIEITGNFWNWNYEIKKQGEIIAKISRKFSYTDVYEINIKNKEDTLIIILIILSIDALHCDNGGTNG